MLRNGSSSGVRQATRQCWPSARKYLLDSFAESGLLNDVPAVGFVRCDEDDLFAAHDPWLGIDE